MPAMPLRCSHFGCLAAPHSTVRTGPSPVEPPCVSASRCWPSWRSSIPDPLSRDKLVAYLWPESGSDDARHLLRDSLYILRSALGDDSVLGTGDDLRLNPDRLTCDLWEFEAALARDDPEAAVGLYHGPFLSGFHLTDAEEFERWVDGERSRLARRYGQALEQLAEREMRGGEPLAGGRVVVPPRPRGSLQLPDRVAVHAGPGGSRRPGGSAPPRQRALRAAAHRPRRCSRA